jgi:hypothetical protein
VPARGRAIAHVSGGGAIHLKREAGATAGLGRALSLRRTRALTARRARLVGGRLGLTSIA